MIGRICSLLRIKRPNVETVGFLQASGEDVPNAEAGYAKGCIFQDTKAGKVYVNVGDADDCDFKQLAFQS